MRVRMYNRETYESYYYTVRDIQFGKNETTIELEDGYKISFDNDIYNSYILA